MRTTVIEIVRSPHLDKRFTTKHRLDVPTSDYVSTKVWALQYDAARKRVVKNQPIASPKVPIISFGDDIKGEAYMMTHTQNGEKGIFKFVKAAPKKK